MLKLLPLALILSICFYPAVADEPGKSKDGPLAFETADNINIRDAAHKKELTCKVYFPKAGGPYPLILFSHGIGGNKDAFSSVGKHWASHGYVVIHPSHSDGLGRRKTTSSQDSDDKPSAQPRRGGLLGGLNDPQKIGDRVADLVLILDSLDKLPTSLPGLIRENRFEADWGRWALFRGVYRDAHRRRNNGSWNGKSKEFSRPAS